MQFTQDLTGAQKELISQGLIQLPFKAGQVVVNEGDPGNSLYIIKKGEIGVYKGDRRVRVLKEGESFGEQSIYLTSTRTMSCIAEVDSVLLTLGRDSVTNILGSQVIHIDSAKKRVPEEQPEVGYGEVAAAQDPHQLLKGPDHLISQEPGHQTGRGHLQEGPAL